MNPSAPSASPASSAFTPENEKQHTKPQPDTQTDSEMNGTEHPQPQPQPQPEVGPDSAPGSEKASSIAARLKTLESAQLGWKKRINETDAVRFTVAGKMGHKLEENPEAQGSSGESSGGVVLPKKKTPKPVIVSFPERKWDQGSASSPDIPTNDPANKEANTLSRSASEPNGSDKFINMHKVT